MGLEALVESYAFWRPSLRTLTFEDIPGMAKQGEGEGLARNEAILLSFITTFDNLSEYLILIGCRVSYKLSSGQICSMLLR